jgi:hypothetical protein
VLNYIKKLPIAPLKGKEGTLHLELLSLVYAESSICPVSCSIEEDDGRDFLTQKYVDQVEHLILKVQGEVIFPVMGLFNCKMFTLNYQKFYS